MQVILAIKVAGGHFPEACKEVRNPTQTIDISGHGCIADIPQTSLDGLTTGFAKQQG
jgi:hypothetical protein